jgi:2-polyprenyl-3-methyl-5-hydroxy-6-metoxy-1,4-benzoquinol methylase
MSAQPGRDRDDTLPAEHFASLARLEDRYWWHQTRYRAALAALTAAGLTPAHSLGDVGCGTGGFLRFLRARGFTRLAGFDMSPVALATTAASGAEVHAVDLAAPFTLAGAPWDALVALDVVEHVADDVAFLSATAAALRPGGLLFVSVPAFPHLYSRWDERLHHHRRYTRRSLATAARAAGLAPLASSYLFAVAYPAALLRRWVGWKDGRGACEFPPVSPLADRLLGAVGRAEVATPAWLRVPLGTSVTILARRLAA